MSRKHIKSLTGIRGFAALWVFLHHITTQYPFENSLPAWLKSFADKGWLGVDLFFVLSGFIISYVHQNDFNKGITYDSCKRFIILRFARVYPVHFATTIALIPIYLLSVQFFNYYSPVDAFSIPKLLYSLSLTNGLGITNSVGWNSPSWSVGSEAFAYLLFPILTFFILRYRISIITNFIACIIIFAITTTIGWHLSDGQRYFSSWEMNLLRITSEFLIGCFLFNIFKQDIKLKLWILADISFIGIMILTIFNIPSCYDMLFIIAFGCLILGLSEDKGLLANILQKKSSIYLGEISYSIYLCHGIVFMVLNALLQKILDVNIVWHYVIAAFLYVLVTWASSHIVYSYIEVKARNYLKEKLLKHTASK